MRQADVLPLQLADEMSDLALHQTLPLELILLCATACLQHDKVAIFTEEVGSIKQLLPFTLTLKQIQVNKIFLLDHTFLTQYYYQIKYGTTLNFNNFISFR